MSNISIRQLDQQIIKKLRIQAAREGVSIEEEIRRILTRAMHSPKKISTVFLSHFGAKHGLKLDTSTHYHPHEPVNFNV